MTGQPRGRWANRSAVRKRNAIIVVLKSEGLSNAEIARRVGLDPSTVSRVLQKVTFVST